MAKKTGRRIVIDDSSDDVAIRVSGVSKSFRLPHNRQNSIKGSLVNLIGGGDRSYETQEVLKDISFEIKKGEFFGIVGRNGSGKSTLLKMLAGIYKPTAGEITVNGSLTPFIELGVGFNPELTGRENVYMNGALLGFNDKEVDAMYDDIVEFAELERFMDQKLKNYSSGMQVRLAFSIAIRAQSEILLIDEVLAVGDAAFQQKCFKYFDALKKDNRTIILVTHDMSAVNRFCDRAALIDKGRLVSEGNPSDVSSKYLLVTNESPEKAKDYKRRQVRTNVNEDLGVEIVGTTMQKSSRSYTPDENVSFKIEYKINKPFKYDFGITIKKDNMSLHERNTKGVTLPPTPGRYILEWSAPAMILLNGLHTIDVAVFSKSGFRLVAYQINAADFIIQRDDKTIAGLVDMNSKWRVEKS